MRRLLIVLLLALGIGPLAAAVTVIQPGDGQVDGTRIRPYQQIWRQCSRQDGAWVDGGTFAETLIEVKDGERMWRLEQSSERPDGRRGQTVIHYDRRSLSPLRMESRQFGPDDTELASASYSFDAQGYKGQVIRGDETREVSGDAVTSQQFPGGNFGLALATLDPEKDFPAELPSSMVQFDAGYRVIATVAGQEALETASGSVDAWLIDVEWHHLGTDDVYPGGPDQSGGRYWVVPRPPQGFPYVPRYQTDTYAVEFVQGTCPASN